MTTFRLGDPWDSSTINLMGFSVQGGIQQTRTYKLLNKGTPGSDKCFHGEGIDILKKDHSPTKSTQEIHTTEDTSTRVYSTCW